MKDSDKKVLAYYQKNPRARQTEVEAATGIKVATIRNIRSRLQRLGLTPWVTEERPPVKIAEPARSVVEIRSTTAARVSESRTKVEISLAPVPQHLTAEEKVVKRMTTPIPELTPEEELKMRRLALIRKVHREGLLRGQFRVRSR